MNNNNNKKNQYVATAATVGHWASPTELEEECALSPVAGNPWEMSVKRQDALRGEMEPGLF